MIEFNANTHQYTLDGKMLISVTQLMKKHGLAPDYGAVAPEVLEAAAKRGTLIHAEIEAYNKRGEIGFSEEMEAYADYIARSGIKCIGSETVVYNDVVAGTIDLLLSTDEGTIIADIKTTSMLHKESVSWQLSIYNALAGYPAAKGQAFHFKDGKLKVVTLPLKPTEEVERLLDCERAGVIYRSNEIVAAAQLAVISEAEAIIAEAEAMKKAAEERMETVKAAIMAAMEQNAVKTVETDAYKITYVEAGTRTTLDSTRLKSELPEIAEKYSKTTSTKPRLLITARTK